MSENEAAAPQRRGLFTRITQATLLRRDELRAVGDVYNALRAPLVVSLIGVIVFAFPGQIYEIYRLYAEDFSWSGGFGHGNVRFGVFMAMLYFTCYVLWYVARVLTVIDTEANAALSQRTAAGRAARWAPRWIGAAPAFAAAIGMVRAEYLRDGGQETPELYGAAAIAFLIGVIRLWSSWRRARDGDYDRIVSGALRADVRLAFAIALLSVIFYLLAQPIAFTQTIGSLSIIAFFMVALVFGWAQLTFLYDRFAIPALSILVGAVLLWSFLDWNDNHFLRELPEDPNVAALQEALAAVEEYGPAPPLTAKDAFEDWLEGRADRQSYLDADQPYPVYVVAAQGGGLYAAYQSAMFMAKLQDACPTFAQHVFAISGVSGGAVGASVFTALTLEHAENQPIKSTEEPCGIAPLGPDGQTVSFENLTNSMLSQDFLSPLISGMLFGDFTARFSPVPIPVFDRARALERAFELSWDQAHPTDADGLTPPNRLEAGILDYWSEEGAAPALFLNTTQAETGRRMVLSPIEKVNSTLDTYAAEVERRPNGTIPDLRLSTAAIASARFPYITPAASMRLKKNPDDGDVFPKLRLVDGGYFENLGIETATDVIMASWAGATRERRERVSASQLRVQREELRNALRNFRQDVDLRLIVFDLTEDRFRPASYAFGEALTPLKAVLNTRVSRTALAQQRARDQFRSPCRYIFLGGGQLPGQSDENLSQVCLPSEVRDSRIWSISLNDFEYDFELGWILSQDTLDRIDEQLGDPRPDGCSPQAVARDPEALAADEPNRRQTLLERRVAMQKRAEALLGFTDGISITGEARGAPQSEDALARHNACIGSFVLDRLRIGPARTPSVLGAAPRAVGAPG